MKPLDFLIIGAQKSATTALFELLQSHPDVAMPIEKEVPFFDSNCNAQDWDVYAKHFFHHAKQDQLWGKATPQYLANPETAARIKRCMPNVKLIALLRDPIDRSYSHYLMGVRRGTEQQSFSDVVQQQLTNNQLVDCRLTPVPRHASGYESERHGYLTWSEYGRLLTPYYQHFDPKSILVLYSEQLKQNPQKTLNTVLQFLGLDIGFQPPALGKEIHKGGGTLLIPHHIREKLRNQAWLYALWNTLSPQQQGRLRFKYEQWNIRKNVDNGVVPAHIQHQLRKLFKQDVQSLLSLPIPTPPWASNYLES